MSSTKEILASPEMADVVTAIRKLRKRFSPYEALNKEHDWPLALVRSEGYNAKRILEILLDDNEYYPGYKDVLSASFSGWLLAPDKDDLRENLIAQAALFYMSDAERAAEFEDGPSLEEDVAARYVYLGEEFIIEILNPLGGSAKLLEAKLDVALWRELENTRKQITTAVRAVVYLHHAVDRLGRPGFLFEPSLNKALWVFDELKGPSINYPFKQRYVSRSLLHMRWTKCKETLALLYAAATIRVGRGTLLSIIIDGFLLDSDHRRYFLPWVGRARYVVEHIFSRMRNKKLATVTSEILGSGPSVGFNPPRLDVDERKIFDSIFARDNSDKKKNGSMKNLTEY